MTATYDDSTGNGSNLNFNYTFPILLTEDVKVALNSIVQSTTKYTVNTSANPTRIEFNNNLVDSTLQESSGAPKSGVLVRVFRETTVGKASGDDDPKAIYAAGSSIRAVDLNANTEQALYAIHELQEQEINGLDITEGTVTSAAIQDGTLTNIDISPTAEIDVSKLADGSARQLLETDATGTGVQWASNIQIPGTLDIIGNTTAHSNLDVFGTARFRQDVQIDTGIVPDVDKGANLGSVSKAWNESHIGEIKIASTNDNTIDTASGNLEIDSAGGTTTIDDNLVVTGTFSAGSVNANTLESLGSGQFLRSDEDDIATGSLYYFGANTSTFPTTKIRTRNVPFEFGSAVSSPAAGGFNAACTMSIGGNMGGVVDGLGNQAILNDINLGHANLGQPISSELNSNNIGHVAHISLGRMYMSETGSTGSTSSPIIMRAAYPDGLMFYHPDTTMNNGRFTSGGTPGTAGASNTYNENITDARNAADMRIITGGIFAKNKVEIGSSSVAGTLSLSGTDVTATSLELNKLDGYTGTTTELNKLHGFTGSTTDLNEVVAGKSVVEQITGSATDAQIPTAQAVNERVVELVTEVGGFHPIANETSFPTTNPDINDGAGTIVSLKSLTSAFSTGSGVTTHTFTNGAGSGVNVIINGLPASTTFQAGKGLLLETTSTLHTYNYHRLVLDESGVSNADALVSAFNERYYGPHAANQATRPSGADRQNGDLYFNTSDGKMKVFNGVHATGSWDDVAAPGNFFINTLSLSSGSGGGSATFNNTATRFTLSNPPLTAQQLLVSVNGVIQKPNSGTSPSEGFAIDGADIIFASAPATGSPFFIVTIGSSVNIGTPSNDTVGAAQIIDGSIGDAEISSTAQIAGSKINPNFVSQALTCGSVDSNGSIIGASLQLDSPTLNYIYYTDSLALAKAGHGAELTIDSSGNVGIGVSGSNISGPLHVYKSTGVNRSYFESGDNHTFLRLLGGTATNNSGIEFFSGSSANKANITARGDTNSLEFEVGSLSPAVEMKDSGNVEIKDGNLELASTHGIHFHNYGSGTNVESNLLDDYEEGTWTPDIRYSNNLSGANQCSYHTRSGQYTKVGRVVTIHGLVNLSSTNSNTGNVYLFGLPFEPLSGHQPLLQFIGDGFDFGSNEFGHTFFLVEGGNNRAAGGWQRPTGWSHISDSQFDSSGGMYITGYYYV